MRSRTVSQCNPCSKFSAIQLALAAALLLGAVDSAHALITIDPPPGWSGGRVYAGREDNGKMRAVYLPGYSGAKTHPNCVVKLIGTNNTLPNGGERTVVRGGNSTVDEMMLIGGLFPTETVCGLTLWPFIGMPKVNLDGRGGNDWIVATVHNESTAVVGGSGNDSMIVGQIAEGHGHDGADRLVSGYPSKLYGEDGNDMFCSYATPPSAVTLADGGAGTDTTWGPFAATSGIDGPESLEDCGMAYSTTIDRLDD